MKKVNLLRILVFASPLIITACMQLRTNTRKTLKKLQSTEYAYKADTVSTDLGEVRYFLTQKSDTLPLVIFIHGAPGSSDDYIHFLKNKNLLDHCRMISFDRPGYGYSSFGQSETSIEKQASVIQRILDVNPDNKKVLLVGHSFGGPIACKFAMDYPSAVNGLLLLAPAIDPDHEKIFWISNFGRWKTTRWAAPTPLKVATDEKFTHIAELELLLDDWGRINIPVTHIHGDKDMIVPYENLEFSKKQIGDSLLKTVSIPKENHFLPWSQEKLVENELLELLEKVK